MIAAAEHGFNVSKPCGNSSRYDSVLELNGCFLRLQVKSTLCRNDRYYICSARTSSRPYTEKRVDFFAVYVIPEDLWYILPVRVVIRCSLRTARSTSTNAIAKPGTCCARGSQRRGQPHRMKHSSTSPV